MKLVIFRIFFAIFFSGLGYGFAYSLAPTRIEYQAIGALGGIVVALAIFWSERYLRIANLQTVFGSILGCSIGVIFGRIFALSYTGLGFNEAIHSFLTALTCATFGYIGLFLGLIKLSLVQWSDILSFFQRGENVRYKILDTSVIIDGRILEICQSAFIEGVLVIPKFVLTELQHIADSSDSIKRNRGRRGLDILNKLRKKNDIRVEIHETDFPDIKEVDHKLLQLAKVLGGKILTNDFNLNKVAELQGVGVLNINELANAVKPIVLPGEDMSVFVIKEGKEEGQGVGYLDDGTMIIVENGTRQIGKEVQVVVTSVLQTTAGRMIFTKAKEAPEIRGSQKWR